MAPIVQTASYRNRPTITTGQAWSMSGNITTNRILFQVPSNVNKAKVKTLTIKIGQLVDDIVAPIRDRISMTALVMPSLQATEALTASNPVDVDFSQGISMNGYDSVQQVTFTWADNAEPIVDGTKGMTILAIKCDVPQGKFFGFPDAVVSTNPGAANLPPQFSIFTTPNGSAIYYLDYTVTYLDESMPVAGDGNVNKNGRGVYGDNPFTPPTQKIVKEVTGNGIVLYQIFDLKSWYEGSAHKKGNKSTYKPESMQIPLALRIDALPNPLDFMSTQTGYGEDKKRYANAFRVIERVQYGIDSVDIMGNEAIGELIKTDGIFINKVTQDWYSALAHNSKLNWNNQLRYQYIDYYYATIQACLWLSTSEVRDEEAVRLILQLSSNGELGPALSIIAPEDSPKTLVVLVANDSHVYEEDLTRTRTFNIEVPDRLFTVDQSAAILAVYKEVYFVNHPNVDPKKMTAAQQAAYDTHLAAFTGKWYMHLAFGVYFSPAMKLNSIDPSLVQGAAAPKTQVATRPDYFSRIPGGFQGG